MHQAAYASSQSQEQPSSIRPDRGQSIDVHRDSFQGKVDPLLQSHRIHSMQASSSFPKYLAATQKVSSQSAQHDNILRPSTSEARPEPPRRIRKTSSYVRLSLSAGGAAEIITKDASSPSPPRPLPSMYPIDGTKLGISVRSETTAQQSPIPSSSMPLQRAGSGRSRDSRSWEFWCDKDGRSELENKAEKDSSGSAADAIQLLRSASGRSILGSIPNKRNSVLHGQEASNKRLRRDYRGPLQRSSTTTGRLQGKTAPGKIPPSLKDTKSALSTHIPGNESDKENWSPGSATQFDEQSLGGDKPSVGLGSRRAKQTSGLTKSHLRREGTDPEADPELAAFMRNGDRSDGSSRSEDLDCVQGLLSLSQGNWR